MFLNQVLAVLSIKIKPSMVTLRFFPTPALFCLQAFFSGILLATKVCIIRLQQWPNAFLFVLPKSLGRPATALPSHTLSIISPSGKFISTPPFPHWARSFPVHPVGCYLTFFICRYRDGLLDLNEYAKYVPLDLQWICWFRRTNMKTNALGYCWQAGWQSQLTHGLKQI